MCGSRHERRHRGSWSRRRYPNREELLQRLEEHQRDLEQEVADVADLIRRLREEPATAGQPASV
jgi:predicted RNase H-like nuclease (RuvC/YqgF family)